MPLYFVSSMQKKDSKTTLHCGQILISLVQTLYKSLLLLKYIQLKIYMSVQILKGFGKEYNLWWKDCLL